eukprot:6193207-Pleurochrysis_carterae.AAC.4
MVRPGRAPTCCLASEPPLAKAPPWLQLARTGATKAPQAGPARPLGPLLVWRLGRGRRYQVPEATGCLVAGKPVNLREAPLRTSKSRACSPLASA